MIPMRTVVRLRTRLMNQNMLTQTDKGVGENDWATGAIVELRGPLRHTKIWDKRLMIILFGSGWRVLYDLTMNAVTTAENSPALNLLKNPVQGLELNSLQKLTGSEPCLSMHHIEVSHCPF